MIKFTALATEQGGIEMWRSHAVPKNVLHWALEAHVHKTAYGPLIDMTHYLGKWEGVGPQMALA